MVKKLRKHKVISIVVTAIIIAAVLSGIVFLRNKNKKDFVKSAQKNQDSIALEKMDLTKSISATGTIESARSETLATSVNGVKIKKVNVKIGDSVKKGDTILTFDTSDLKDTLADAKEELADAKEDYNNSVSSAQDKIADAKETYSDEKENQEEKIADARKALEKIKKQIKNLKKKIQSEKDMQTNMSLEEKLEKLQENKKSAQNEYETAKSNRDNTNKQNQSSIENAEDTLKTAESNGKKSIKEAEKQVKEAEKNLGDCSVTATIDGIVTSVYVEAGNTYNGGNIVQIDDTSLYKVTTSVDEYDISSVSTGQRAVILTAATDEDEIEGEITFVAPSAGSSTQSESSMTGNTSSSDGYEVGITLNTKDERLRLGMTARCSIILEEVDDVYAVPYDAIHENEDGVSVIYVEDRTIDAKWNIPEENITEENSTEENNTGGDNTVQDATGGENTAGYKEIEVTKGMESDYYVEISGAGLSEGLRVIIPVDEDVSSGSEDNGTDNGTEGFQMPGSIGGSDMPGMGGRTPGNGGPGNGKGGMSGN